MKSHYNADSVIPFPAPKLDSAAEEQQASSIEHQKVVSDDHIQIGAFFVCGMSLVMFACE